MIFFESEDLRIVVVEEHDEEVGHEGEDEDKQVDLLVDHAGDPNKPVSPHLHVHVVVHQEDEASGPLHEIVEFVEVGTPAHCLVEVVDFFGVQVVGAWLLDEVDQLQLFPEDDFHRVGVILEEVSSKSFLSLQSEPEVSEVVSKIVGLIFHEEKSRKHFFQLRVKISFSEFAGKILSLPLRRDTHIFTLQVGKKPSLEHLHELVNLNMRVDLFMKVNPLGVPLQHRVD